MAISDFDGFDGSGKEDPFHVVGIALVVEEVGKGARLVFRYPASASASRSKEPSDGRAPDKRTLPPKQKAVSHDDDMFFALPPRVMAKLFRLKPPLCDQPTTLSIGGTVFCCRASLLPSSPTQHHHSQGPSSQQQTNDNSTAAPIPTNHPAATAACGTQQPNDGLVLFSVIVALSPMQQLHQFGRSCVGCRNPMEKSKTPAYNPSSPSFLAIRRIHLSLARLCRVLEREERRCLYVSRQSQMLLRIKSGRDTDDHHHSDNDNNNSGRATKLPAGSSSSQTGASSSNGGAGSGATGSLINRPTLMRTESESAPTMDFGHSGGTMGFSGSAMGFEINNNSTLVTMMSAGEGSAEVRHRRARDDTDQAILELMLAAAPPPPVRASTDHEHAHTQTSRSLRIPLHGNLARELALVYHSFSRNEDTFQPTPSSLLTGQDGVVYINRHVAVPIEAATLSTSHDPKKTSDSEIGKHSTNYSSFAKLRPYHTLLFPHASPTELLQHLTSSSQCDALNNELYSSQQRLQKLLLMADPSKSLRDMAADTALPLPILMESAISLLEAGACIAVPVIHRSTQFSCQHDAVVRMSSLALPFAQKFGPMLPIFVVVSALTICTVSTLKNSNVHEEVEDGEEGDYNSEHGTLDTMKDEAPANLGDVIALCCDAISEEHAVRPNDNNDNDTEYNVHPSIALLAERLSSTLRLESVPPGFMVCHDGTIVPKHYRTYYHPPDFVHNDVCTGSHTLAPAMGKSDIVAQEMGGGGRLVLTVALNPQVVEDAIFAMAVWLRAHSVIVEVQEYLVSICDVVSAKSLLPLQHCAEEPTFAPAPSHIRSIELKRQIAAKDKTTMSRNDASSLGEEERLYTELLETGYLNGNVSTLATCWRLGLDSRRLRRLKEWGEQEKKLQVVTRIPGSDDDWGAA